MKVGGLGNTTSKSKEIELKSMHECKRMRMNVELDRLSSLPDDLIHKICSFIDIKHVVQTSVLSSRWMFIWTSTPYLNFSMDDSTTLLEFSNVVKRVLTGRNNEIDVSSVKLLLRGMVNRGFVKRILYYAFSHNVQDMTITSLGKKIVFPHYLFNSISLKHFTLRGPGYSTHSLRVTSTLDLPSLTTLHLDQVTLNVDNSDSYFAKCVNLKSLTLNHCKMLGSDGFTICHPQLLSLTLISAKGVVKVIASQLKNIYLVHSHDNSFPCFSNALPSLEKVDICIGYPHRGLKIINMLQELCSVKYLTMNVEIVEFLSSKVDLISNQPSPFANLKTLKIYPLTGISVGRTLKRVDVSTEVKSYLLDGSHSATFTMVSREEVKAIQEVSALKNADLALKCIRKVQVLLHELKTELNLNKRKMDIHNEKMHDDDDDDDKGKAKVEDEKGNMKQIQSCWKDLSLRVAREQAKVSHIFSELKYIEELLTYIPPSKKVKMQELFANMCEEANIVMDNTLEHIKIRCDMKHKNLSIHFRQLSNALQPSS